MHDKRQGVSAPGPARPQNQGWIGDERGFTLIELMISVTILTFVLGATLALLDGANKTAARDQERGLAMNEDLAGFNRMVAELGQAYKINYPTSQSSSDAIDFNVRLRVNRVQQDRRVQYICGSAGLSNPWNRCLRYEDAVTDGAAPGTAMAVTPTVVVPQVANETTHDPSDPVFQGLSAPDGSTGRPTYGDVVVKAPSTGGRNYNAAANFVVLRNSFYASQLTYAH